MVTPRLRASLTSFALLTALSAPLSGCCWLDKSKCPDGPGNVYERTALAVDKSARSIHGQYGSCLPSTYDKATFISDLQKIGDLHAEDMKMLQAADLDVWTDHDCVGYVLVAKNKGQTLLWDRSETRSTLDGPGNTQPMPPVPARQPPQSCTCTVAQQ
jgi:hypothetical protein